MKSHATLPWEFFYVAHRVGDDFVAGPVFGPYTRLRHAEVTARSLCRKWPDRAHNVIILRTPTTWTLVPKEKP